MRSNRVSRRRTLRRNSKRRTLRRRSHRRVSRRNSKRRTVRRNSKRVSRRRSMKQSGGVKKIEIMLKKNEIKKNEARIEDLNVNIKKEEDLYAKMDASGRVIGADPPQVIPRQIQERKISRLKDEKARLEISQAGIRSQIESLGEIPEQVPLLAGGRGFS